MYPSEYTSDSEEHSMAYNAVESQIKFLQGKVLTVIDASFPQGEQKKAIKDLINQKFSEQLNHISNISRVIPTGDPETEGVGIIAESFSDAQTQSMGTKQ